MREEKRSTLYDSVDESKKVQVLQRLLREDIADDDRLVEVRYAEVGRPPESSGICESSG